MRGKEGIFRHRSERRIISKGLGGAKERVWRVVDSRRGKGEVYISTEGVSTGSEWIGSNMNSYKL